MDQAHPGTVDHNVHRNPGLGTWVLINGRWYYSEWNEGNALEHAPERASSTHPVAWSNERTAR
jgi:hypothetical protein